jgi:predicted 3-demethylubiquinone-9 3-methyltransferase (glyoxalase superfamily)
MLWYNDQAEEAANLYLSIFGTGNISNISRGPDGKAFTVNFELLGENYIGLNGGPMHTFSEGFSIFIHCDGQEEVDRYWNAFIGSGGTEGRCGWLKDKFGLSWQIIPRQLGECLGNSDPAKAGRAMAAMMKMSKIIVSELEGAIQ